MSPSPSGVASLRARFEQNKQDNNTSPPSRGRSPTGGVAGEDSRPMNKVRTNFVAVEPSGNMTSSVEVPTALPTSNDGAQESKSATKLDKSNKQERLNGHVAGSAQVTNGDGTMNGQFYESADNGHADQPILAPEESRDAVTSSGNLGVEEDNQGLGSILKGSPFEGEESKKQTAAEKSATRSQISKQLPKSTKTTATIASTKPSVPAPVSRPAKDVEPISPTEPHISEHPGNESTESTAPLSKAKAGEATKLQSQAQSRSEAPGAIQTKKVPPSREQSAKATSGEYSANKNSTKFPHAPRTPSSTILSQKRLPADMASPKTTSSPTSTAPKDPSTQPKTRMQKAANGLSTVAKAPVAAAKSAASKHTALNATAAKSTKKTTPASPPDASKTRPKSPSRPMRLSVSATAPTAASTAKHDGEGASAPRSPSRQSNVNTATKGRTASLSKPTRSARVSLPARSKPMDKPKPKPRTSTASTAAPSGGFLERMMRPTQSSAQKTHEKVEPKSPPRKTAQSAHPTKSKRKSGGSIGTKSDGKGAQSYDDPALESKEGKGMNLDTESADMQSLPLTNSAATNNDEVAEEVESGTPKAAIEAEST